MPMASLAGFEPATHCLEGSCSVLLRYRDTQRHYISVATCGEQGQQYPQAYLGPNVVLTLWRVYGPAHILPTSAIAMSLTSARVV